MLAAYFLCLRLRLSLRLGRWRWRGVASERARVWWALTQQLATCILGQIQHGCASLTPRVALTARSSGLELRKGVNLGIWGAGNVWAVAGGAEGQEGGREDWPFFFWIWRACFEPTGQLGAASGRATRAPPNMSGQAEGARGLGVPSEVYRSSLGWRQQGSKFIS